MANNKKLTLTQYIELVREIHGDKYDYSKITTFAGMNSRITIGCPVHGDIVVKAANHLYNKSGCRKCVDEAKRMGLAEFVDRSNQEHDHKYDYSQVKFVNLQTPVIIICPIHGEFLQKPVNHLHYGAGCNKCAQSNASLSLNAFIMKANLKHHSKYDYSRIHSFSGVNNVYSIICPYHGEFSQLGSNHLLGHGCAECATDSKRKPLDQFIADSIALFGIDQYDYATVVYRSNAEKVQLRCTIHDQTFWQTPKDHLSGNRGCARCQHTSKGEHKLREILTSMSVPFAQQYSFQGCRYVNPLPFDFIIYGPNNQLGLIEYDGEHHYHPVQRSPHQSEAEVSEQYEFQQVKDRIKTEYCKQHHIPLLRIAYTQFDQIEYLVTELYKLICAISPSSDVQVHSISLTTPTHFVPGDNHLYFYPDELEKKPAICAGIIAHREGKNIQKLFARKCRIEVLEKTVASKFLIDNHIQGTVGCESALGLKYQDELVLVMTFGKCRYSKHAQYELLRLASKIGYSVVGGAEKLWKYFQEHYQPLSVISYCDTRLFSGSVYEKLGFQKVSTTIGMCFTDGQHRWNRSAFMKHKCVAKLKEQGIEVPSGRTGVQICEEFFGVHPIWDRGQDTWLWK